MEWFLSLIGAAALLLMYMYFKARGNYIDKHEIYHHASKRLNIFFISDVHNRVINEKMLRRVEDNVDVVIVGGDLVDKRVPLHRLITNVKRLKRWGAPVYFIPGNNDHELTEARIVDVLKNESVHVLSNQDVKLSFDDRLPCTLSGVDPYYLTSRRHASYIHDTKDFHLLVVHDPYVFQKMNKEDRDRFSLVLTGHTHGGQIRLFGFGPYTRGGWFTKEDYTLLISEGYGTSAVPLRLSTRAECHMIYLLPEREDRY
ncbi:metallophosphoesterase family protein [Halobacillus salinarum]|uniref:Metallophosphoesterase family protein n=1 Tax=Halobacillus salinarum TaxID=2932257 RepID=A0ABY4EE06_9BACI|nr:metallophosphoesterase [Halobacillus salinarum]UOQ42682.1 metallophosphoesterase family protein [Halobacillus salinarum]